MEQHELQPQAPVQNQAMEQQQPQQAPLRQLQEQNPQQAPVQQREQGEEVSEPPPAYQPPTKMEQPQPHPQLVPGVVPLDRLGAGPQWIDCPFCERRTQTRVEKDGTGMQVLTGFLCCLVCVCLACVPCMAGWFEEWNYYCNGCGRRVACKKDDHLQVFGPTTIVLSKYASRGPHTAGSEANADKGTRGQTD